MGNGTSRQGIPWAEFRALRIGCNAIAREGKPLDLLVIVDEAIAKEATKDLWPDRYAIVTRENAWGRQRIEPHWQVYFYEREHEARFAGGTLSAGCVAYWAACLMGAPMIYLLGFDGTANLDNVYQDTPGYGTRPDPGSFSLYEHALIQIAHEQCAFKRTRLVWDDPTGKHPLPFQRVTREELCASIS